MCNKSVTYKVWPRPVTQNITFPWAKNWLKDVYVNQIRPLRIKLSKWLRFKLFTSGLLVMRMSVWSFWKPPGYKEGKVYMKSEPTEKKAKSWETLDALSSWETLDPAMTQVYQRISQFHEKHIIFLFKPVGLIFWCLNGKVSNWLQFFPWSLDGSSFKRMA
jgi:hypothetical protein